MDPSPSPADDAFAVHPREVRSALKRSSLVDPFLCARYSLSPYMACGHGCAYCDGRAERYWVEGVFDRDIVVRRNLPDLLRRELPRLRERAPIAVGSGIADAYQPLESRERIMAECAAILADAALPVTILTKSTLITRDIDAWARVNERAGFMLDMSIATLDETVRRRFEPGAPPIAERLETLRAFSRRGIAVGVMAMPLLPFIGDGEPEIRELVTACRDAGAAFVMPGGLTLRPGRQKDFFLARLAESCPELLLEYRRIYGEERASGACTRDYRSALEERCARVCREIGVPFLLPHALYRRWLPLYDEVHLLLQHMAELYGARGVSTAPLTAAARGYATWLNGKKTGFNRRRSLTQEELEAEARALFAGDGALEVLGNEKLAVFLRRVVVDREVFDYTTLTLSRDPGSPIEPLFKTLF
ncbi:MAG TPA: radical SAM protein [Spirochaetia bacterium]